MTTTWGPIGREVYERTYSRRKPDGSKETWPETVERVVDGNLALVPSEFHWPNERELLIDLITQFKLVPAGRHLWVSGVPGRQFLFNCHRAGWTHRLADHFGFTFNELMKGGGIGANFSNEYLERAHPVSIAPKVTILCSAGHPDVLEVQPDPRPETSFPIVVADSREGWVDALEVLIDAHQYGWPGDHIVFDVSGVRQRGSLIRGFGGTASGPGPLADMLRSTARVLSAAVGRRLTSLEAMQIDHEISRCVIAGNVRRSARMSMKHWKDEDILDFINCKQDSGSHWSTNISVEIDNDFFASLREGDPHAQLVMHRVCEGMLHNGEPGFYNSSRASIGERGDVRCTNPCGEIALEEWENCNLGHLNLALLAGPTERLLGARLMARYLIRATFSDITDKRQRQVVDRNRRIGVGLFGFQEWVANEFALKYSECHIGGEVENELLELYAMVDAEATGYAASLGIPKPIKLTTVAPTGTIAKMPGNSEGIHPIYAKHFVRNVRFADDDPNLAAHAKVWHTEPCVYSAKTTVVSFVCRDQIYEVVKPHRHDLIESVDEIDLIDMLAVQAMVQNSWADNAVSFTVNFPDGQLQLEDVVRAMRHFLPQLKGTTLMPDGTRPQSPYVRISEDEWAASQQTVASASFDDCAGGACPIK